MIHSLVTNFNVVLFDENQSESDSEEEEDAERPVILGLNSKDCLEPYIDILVQSMAYGSHETIEYTIDFYNILAKHTTTEYLQPVLFRLMGPLVRAMNFKTETYLKIKLVRLLLKIFKLNLDVSQFNSPLQYSLIKGLKDSVDPQLVKLYINTLIALHKTSSQPTKIYTQCLRQFHLTKNQNFLQFIYNLMKRVPSALDEETQENLHEFLLDPENQKLLCNFLFFIGRQERQDRQREGQDSGPVGKQ